MNWHDPESDIVSLSLNLSEGVAEAEIVWKGKDGGPVIRTLNLMSAVPSKGETAEVFEAARKAILNVIAVIEQGRFSVDEDSDEGMDGMGWS